MLGILFIAAAAPAAMPQPATDTVVVEVSAGGVATVPAQAFQVGAFIGLAGAPSDIGKVVDMKALKARLAPLELPDRKACMPALPFGFVGNEAYTDDGETDDPDNNVGTRSGTTAGTPAAGPVTSPQSYSGLFRTQADAAEAVNLLRAQGHARATTSPVLFDCEDAVKLAQLDALAKAQKEVQPIADALGMKVRGITRVEFDTGETAVMLSLTMMSSRSNNPQGQIDFPASAKVDFLLGK